MLKIKFKTVKKQWDSITEATNLCKLVNNFIKIFTQ